MTSIQPPASLVAYNNLLRNIKLHNIPSMAARLAKTILELPRSFTQRFSVSGTTVTDNSGQVFDTVWGETVGHKIACVNGVSLTDARNTLDMLQDLERQLIKWQCVYIGSKAANAEFVSDHNRFDSSAGSGQWVSLLNKASSISRTNVNKTYANLGFILDQENLSDDPAFRSRDYQDGAYYDTYSFLIEVANTPLHDVVSAIVMLSKSKAFTSSSNSYTTKISAAVTKALSLYSAVSDIVLDMNRTMENLAPVMKSGGKQSALVSSQAVTDVVTANTIVNFNPATLGWDHPDKLQPTSFVNAVTNIPAGKYRVSFVVKPTLNVSYLKLDGSVIEMTTMHVPYGSGDNNYAVYLSDVMDISTSSELLYLVTDSSGASTVDASKITVYILGTSNADMSQIRVVSNPVDIGPSTPIVDPDDPDTPLYSTVDVKYYPIKTDSLIDLYINSAFEITNITYAGDTLSADNTAADDSHVVPGYTYHKVISKPTRYTSTSSPVTVTYKVPTGQTFSADSVSYSWDSHDESSMNTTKPDADGAIASRRFPSTEWIDITSAVMDNLPDSWNTATEATELSINVPMSDLAELGVDTHAAMVDYGVLSVLTEGSLTFPQPTGSSWVGTHPGFMYVSVTATWADSYTNAQSVYNLNGGDQNDLVFDDSEVVSIFPLKKFWEHYSNPEMENIAHLTIKFRSSGRLSFIRKSVFASFARGTRIFVRTKSASVWHNLEHPAVGPNRDITYLSTGTQAYDDAWADDVPRGILISKCVSRYYLSGSSIVLGELWPGNTNDKSRHRVYIGGVSNTAVSVATEFAEDTVLDENGEPIQGSYTLPFAQSTPSSDDERWYFGSADCNRLYNTFYIPNSRIRYTFARTPANRATQYTSSMYTTINNYDKLYWAYAAYPYPAIVRRVVEMTVAAGKFSMISVPVSGVMLLCVEWPGRDVKGSTVIDDLADSSTTNTTNMPSIVMYVTYNPTVSSKVPTDIAFDFPSKKYEDTFVDGNGRTWERIIVPGTNWVTLPDSPGDYASITGRMYTVIDFRRYTSSVSGVTGVATSIALSGFFSRVYTGVGLSAAKWTLIPLDAVPLK